MVPPLSSFPRCSASGGVQAAAAFAAPPSGPAPDISGGVLLAALGGCLSFWEIRVYSDDMFSLHRQSAASCKKKRIIITK